MMSYHGPLDFLISQELSDATFPFPEPTDIVTEPKKSVLNQLASLVHRCTMHTFLHALYEDYVGTIEDMTFESINDISKTLRQFRMEYSIQGKQCKVYPTSVYRKYLQVMHLLPDDSQKWGFTFMIFL
jgi:hypothetical protein